MVKTVNGLEVELGDLWSFRTVDEEDKLIMIIRLAKLPGGDSSFQVLDMSTNEIKNFGFALLPWRYALISRT